MIRLLYFILGSLLVWGCSPDVQKDNPNTVTVYVSCIDTVTVFARFPNLSSGALDSLVRLSYAEAGIDGTEGVKAVVWALERRMEHSTWRDKSLSEIISQPGQFDGYQSKHYNSDIPEWVYQAVYDAITQPNELPQEYVYFWNPDWSTCSWYYQNIALPGNDRKIIIGRHHFLPDPKYNLLNS